MNPYTILALDPGPVQTGWARLFVDGVKPQVLASGVMPNEEMLFFLVARHGEQIAIEMIASYGMAVGREVFETCVWIGRFQQACHDPGAVRLVYRKDVKMFLCGTARAKDSNIRQALLDMLGPQGVKAAPGPTYGVKSHAWPALAVAVTAASQGPCPDCAQAALKPWKIYRRGCAGCEARAVSEQPQVGDEWIETGVAAA